MSVIKNVIEAQAIAYLCAGVRNSALSA